MEVEIIDGVEWRRERYSNGQLFYETPVVNGKFHGLRRWWDENGQLRYVGLWNNGRFVFKAYNPPQSSGIWKLK